MSRIGIIGYGVRLQNVVDLMQGLNAGTEITAIADIRPDKVVDRLRGKGCDVDRIRMYTDTDEMLDKEDLDGVMIGTRCSLHAQFAIKVLARNLPLFLEKPVATNMQDLLALRDAAENSVSEVVVSFPLRVTPIVQLAREIIDSGRIGSVEHVQAHNNPPYGSGGYFQWWYRDESETGGLFLQKATHDFDYINYLLRIQPQSICAMTSKQVFKGNHPAGLHCRDCSDNKTCTDSPHNPFVTHCLGEYALECNLQCAFATDTGNEDSGSALIRYESGMHVSYTQNFFSRNKAASRGAILIGHKGTIDFDWYRDELKVYMHHTPRVETYAVASLDLPHGGGDLVLADNFVKVVRGECRSVPPLSAGLLSALMCLRARESAATATFQEITWPDGKTVPRCA